MKYIVAGSIIYVIVSLVIPFLLYKNGDPRRTKVSDEEYEEFLIDIEKQKQEKLNKINKKKRKGEA